ncbi:LOW QUALITY PROTEIN: G-type lectin S-receptor-like serine/threonine-protein kinase At1g61500 [Arabidopsis lyrata subsp. lyrata]|uniref:LOW QUALITY PROTEIN: G-type lectin S-receptor-like serine/threonine-protein kinase At1g61500 n=1 Tax=Arabidopsis lyrata subsp. lyrata TaxID=81972 RepID=UPI000A29DE09|nr:LOW QUALITY PROTEIN: G-type lectin S-receptor-like serine/threonine-protein kinase At1g61500 [Arabidopsis lyrata subsp. lyrata]|eukprot:XP_020890047.1 LOW QUALITY PROTEIN: G-type lectin S-receptor-like serine/threonine-protein kinase At1g61500 [Arabidopsis lyrata subsp. lyrata]
MTRFACLHLFTMLLFTMLSSSSYAVITTESPLSMGQTLSSANEVYELGFFSPNNTQDQYVGVWFKDTIPRVVVWVANREKPITDSTANLAISSNGSLLLFNGKHGIVWSSGVSFASSRCRAELLDSENLVVIDIVSGRFMWQSFEHLGDTLLHTASLTYNLATAEKQVLNSWKSYTDPSPGDFLGQITPQVPSQGFIMRGSTPYWRSGPWAKTRFTGIPFMDESYTGPFTLHQDVNGSGYLTYFQKNYKLSRITLTSEGSVKMFRDNGMGWELYYEAPKNSCDFYGACGPFGLCVMSVPPKCKCFKGFVPKSIEEWKMGNWTGACVRRTVLDCSSNSTGKDTDVFHPIANIKPPDFYEFASSVNAEECHQRCLHNCSCLAFAYIKGIGCLVWNQDLMDAVQFSATGELLSIRLARSELDGNKRKKTIVASTVSLTLFVILGFTAFGVWRCRVEHNAHISKDAWRNDLKPQDVPGLDFFDMNTIQNATNNFSLSNKLGQGGFGSVYKGKLQDGKEIAVKRLSSSSGQGKEEFKNEILLISKLQHRNLVRVLGCCIEGDERLLIYEFMVNKSLDTFIFDSRKRLEIDWPKRFDIIQGIARGLLYLHRDSRLRVIHRDLKVSNILLDEKMNPKISDFGLARMYQGTEYQDNTRRVVGTLGYMSPEYAWTGMFSEKSDIYSFGVLLLEIISGKKISRFSYGEDGKTLLAYAWESWSENGGIDLLNKDVADSCHPLEVGRCVQIGLLCVQHNPADRPNTLELLSMLTTTSDLPSPKQPTFALHARDDEPQFRDLSTVNEMTQSLILAR